MNFGVSLLKAAETSELKRAELADAVERNIGTFRELPEEIGEQVILAAQGDISVGSILINLLETGLGLEDDRAKNYWARKFSEAAHDEEDIPALLSVLRSPNLNQAHTAARKAIRLIDFLSNGPSVEQRDNDIA